MLKLHAINKTQVCVRLKNVWMNSDDINPRESRAGNRLSCLNGCLRIPHAGFDFYNITRVLS